MAQEKGTENMYVRIGDSIGVVMDTANGYLTFVLNGMNFRIAFKKVPLDKPLVPCVILEKRRDSVELDLFSEVKENTDTSIPIPPSIIVRNGNTWDSLILEWGDVKEASFYQLEFDGKIINDLNKTKKFVKRGLLPDTEHKFRVRAVFDNSIGEWNGIIKRKTLKKSFETSGWKKFYDYNKKDNYLFTNENNLRTVSTTSYCYCVIGNTSLPLNKIVSWSTCTPSGYGNAGNFYSGVAPFYVNQTRKIIITSVGGISIVAVIR